MVVQHGGNFQKKQLKEFKITLLLGVGKWAHVMWEELKYESTVFYYKAIEFDFFNHVLCLQ